MSDQPDEAKLSLVAESLLDALVEALTKDGLAGCDTLSLAKDVFQTGDDPHQLLGALQEGLKHTAFEVSEELEVVTIGNARTNEKLKLEMVFGGSEGSEVLSAYLEDIVPTAGQLEMAEQMVGKFRGGCEHGGDEPVPTDTEFALSESGLLHGSYVWHHEDDAPEQGSMHQVDVISDRHVMLRLEDGMGFLSALFNEDFSEFDGVFFHGTEDPDEGQFWNGRRQGPG